MPTAVSPDPRLRLAWPILPIALLLIAGLLLFGCSSGASDKAAKTVTIAGIAYPYKGGQSYGDLTGVVLQQGWLKQELAKKGVQLVFTPVPTAVGAPLINEGFSAKRIDFSAYGDFPAIIAVSGGVPLKLVTPVGHGQNSYLVVRNGLQANSIADLKGKRIALHRGRPWELPFSKLLDANGLKFSDFTIVNINPSATPAALASGNVDAAFLLRDGLLLADKGVGRVIWSTKQAPTDWKMRAELFARAAFVDQNPELTQLVVDAFVRAAAWSSREENKAQVITATARGAMPENIVERDLAGTGMAWRDRYSPLFDPQMAAHYRSVADYAFQRGLIRSKVDTDKLLDDRFVKNALRTLKLEGYWSAPATAAAPQPASQGARS